jgi:FMN phosphatase YigB (HAD superfamily)
VIRAIAFDYGGVISLGGRGNEVGKKLASNLRMPIETLNLPLKNAWGGFVMWKFSETQFWSILEEGIGTSIAAEHCNIWNGWDIMAPLPVMLDFVEQLKAAGLIVALLSNVVPPTQQLLEARGVYRHFQPCILSCKVGYAKPDAENYTRLLNELPGIHPEEVVFIDDQEHCLVPARQMRMHTILAIEPKQVQNDIGELMSVSQNNVQ